MRNGENRQINRILRRGVRAACTSRVRGFHPFLTISRLLATKCAILPSPFLHFSQPVLLAHCAMIINLGYGQHLNSRVVVNCFNLIWIFVGWPYFVSSPFVEHAVSGAAHTTNEYDKDGKHQRKWKMEESEQQVWKQKRKQRQIENRERQRERVGERRQRVQVSG